MQTRITLFKWVWRAYSKTSVFPLLVLELCLISVYFLSNRFSNNENAKAFQADALQELSHLAAREANGINHQLSGIVSATEYLQNYSAAIMSNPKSPIRDNPARFKYSIEGAYYTTKDTGGSAVFYSGFVPIGKTERDKAMRSAGVDPALIGIKQAFPLVSQTYINTHDSLNRIYPYFDVLSQYPVKMDIPSYNFYYEADVQHNPARKPVWTDVYIDPAGKGWMTSCIAPVFNQLRPDFLEGVVGIDITIMTIVDEVKKLEIPWHGYAVLVSRSGSLLALPQFAESEWGIQGLTQSNYTGAVTQNTFRAEQFNINSKPAIAKLINAKEKGIEHFYLANNVLMAWATIPVTGWKIFIIAPEEQIFQPANSLADRLNQIAFLMIGGMLIFYTVFLMVLFRRARTMSLSLSDPLKKIDSMVAEIAAGTSISTQHEFPVEELNSTASGILDMGMQLGLAKKARDEATEELQRKSEQLQVIFDVSPSAYLLINHNQQVVLTNNAFSELLAISKQEALTLSENEFLTRFAGLTKEPIQISEAKRTHCRIELVRPRPASVICGVREIYLQNNTLSGKVYFFHDITKDEEIDRIKNDFLAHATHELRTPLASILGYSELLLSGRIPTEMQPNMLTVIHQQSEHLVKMINELLDLTKIAEREGSDFTILPYSLTAIIEEAILEYEPPQNRPSIDFHPPNSDIMINIDNSRFKQVLLNIIDNAYKYSEHSNDPISINVDYCEDNHAVKIEITDHGIGMSDTECAQAFDRFFRADKSGSIPGNGLGLSIAKEIMSLLDGTIEIQSRLKEGTRVTLRLPVVNQQKNFNSKT